MLSARGGVLSGWVGWVMPSVFPQKTLDARPWLALDYLGPRYGHAHWGGEGCRLGGYRQATAPSLPKLHRGCNK